jgi:hypothetical protein
MMQGATEDLITVNAAAELLRQRGAKPHTRHSIYTSIARKRIAVAASTDKMVFLTRAEFERYAASLPRCEPVTEATT